MQLRNLTPHPVIITTDAGSVHLPPEPGPRPQVNDVRETAEPVLVEGLRIPTVRVTGSCAVQLPRPVPDTLFIVSRIIAEACPERTDLLVPYDLVRDETGRVIACRSLAQIAIAAEKSRPMQGV